MAELVEIHFEKIDFSFFPKVYKTLSDHGKELLDFNFVAETQDLLDPRGPIEEAMKEIEVLKDNGSLFMNLEKIKIESYLAENVSFQVLKYDGHFDFLIIMDLSEFNKMEGQLGIDGIISFSKSLASQISAAEYYCGLEPASDEETRFFTNENVCLTRN